MILSENQIIALISFSVALIIYVIALLGYTAYNHFKQKNQIYPITQGKIDQRSFISTNNQSISDVKWQIESETLYLASDRGENGGNLRNNRTEFPERPDPLPVQFHYEWST